MEVVIEYFFAYWPSIPQEKVFHYFDLTHLCAIAVVSILLFWLVNMVRKLSAMRVERILRGAAILLPLVEITRIIWVFCAGDTQLVKLLPLHLCGMQIFYIPLAVFTKSLALKEFVCSTSLLGGIAAILSPSGIAETYPFFHFQTLQSITLHMILIFVPLVMIYCQGFHPNIRNMPKVMCFLTATAVPAAVVDYFWGENYMFLLEPPLGTPLVDIFEKYGHGFYLIVLFLMMCLAIFLTYLPSLWREYKAVRARSRSHRPL